MICTPALSVVVMPNKLAVDKGNSALLSRTTTPKLLPPIGGFKCLVCFIIVILFYCSCIVLYLQQQSTQHLQLAGVGGWEPLVVNRCVVAVAAQQ